MNQVREFRVRERYEVLRSQLDLEAAPPRADEDRLPIERRGVDHRRQPPSLAEWADPAGDVAGRALGLLTVGHLRALAGPGQVELPIGRHDEDAQVSVDGDDKRLEELRRRPTESG